MPPEFENGAFWLVSRDISGYPSEGGYRPTIRAPHFSEPQKFALKKDTSWVKI